MQFNTRKKHNIVKNHQITKTLVSEEQVQKTVQRLGAEITAHYGRLERELMVIGLLRGSFIFMADLVRQIKIPLVVDFMTLSSYGDGTISSGDVKVVMDLDSSIEDRDVLLVEDIVDTGVTLDYLMRVLSQRRPRSLAIASFLDKPSRRQRQVDIRYRGFEVPNQFVVGYGLDFAGSYRNLPDLCAIREE